MKMTPDNNIATIHIRERQVIRAGVYTGQDKIERIMSAREEEKKEERKRKENVKSSLARKPRWPARWQRRHHTWAFSRLFHLLDVSSLGRIGHPQALYHVAHLLHELGHAIRLDQDVVAPGGFCRENMLHACVGTDRNDG